MELWALRRNYVIDFDYCIRDEVDTASKTITVNTRQGIEKQLYSLLHECGHILVRKNNKSFAQDYPNQHKAEAYPSQRRYEKSKQYKTDVIMEEVEAWRRGYKLAKRLNININKKNYDNLARECLYSYIKWAS